MTYTLIVVMCLHRPLTGGAADQSMRYVCTDVPVATYKSIQACDDARQKGKGSHRDAVLYRCRESAAEKP
jgi:hypothetical protein